MAAGYDLVGRDRAAALYQAIQKTSGAIDQLLADEFGPEYRFQIYARLVHHYTDLNAARLLIEFGNVWLSDARYCNDRREIEQARAVIRHEFGDIMSSGAITPPAGPAITLQPQESTALNSVWDGYDASFPDLVAFVCCLCAGNGGLTRPQDILSQWRAYGSNGNGGCVSFTAGGIERAISKNPNSPPNPQQREDGFLFEPVLYEDRHQKGLVRALTFEAVERARRTGSNIDVPGLIDALLMISPLMKHLGFKEEHEWRIVLLPRFAASPIAPKFRARPDLLVPFVDIESVLQRRLSVAEVMVGPSNIPELNEQAMRRVPNAPATILKSEIPYRI